MNSAHLLRNFGEFGLESRGIAVSCRLVQREYRLDPRLEVTYPSILLQRRATQHDAFEWKGVCAIEAISLISAMVHAVSSPGSAVAAMAGAGDVDLEDAFESRRDEALWGAELPPLHSLHAKHRP